MKIKLETTANGFRAILDIETEKDAEDFHDKVVIKLTKGPHDLNRDAYHRSLGEKVEDAEYII